MNAIIARQVEIAASLAAADIYEPLPECDGYLDIASLEARARAVNAEDFDGEYDPE